MTHYDFTGDPLDGVMQFGGTEAEPIVRIVTGPEITASGNVTVTFRLGSLTPSTVKDMWETCEFDMPGEEGFREALAQYFFNCVGQDIADKFGGDRD